MSKIDGCIKLLDIFSDNESMSLVFHHYNDGDLYSYCKEMNPIFRQLPYSQIQSIFTQLVTTVKKLHSMGIIHRDIKPLNILVNAFTQ